MRRLIVALFGATAALVAAVALYMGMTLPPRAVQLDGPWPENLVLGAYHIHSSRSDGTGTIEEIATAAARAGVAFVIVTDHGDATREPDAPTYRHGVLCIDAQEINSFGGHVVALNVRHAAPYPLAGEVRDVVEDIHRLGGWAVAAHPDSPRADLRWRPGALGVDGLEWLNVDSEWRALGLPTLGGAAVRSFLRPAETLSAMFERPERSLRRWDLALRLRPVFSIAALDAHARLGFDDQVPAGGAVIARPRYEDLFRSLAQVVELRSRLSGDADVDATAVIEAIVSGRSFSLVRGFAGPAALSFSASRGALVAGMGESLPEGPEDVVLRAVVPAAPESRVTLLRDGRVVAEGRGSIEFVGGAIPGAYRVEAFFGTHAAPWIVSNAIRVGGAVPLPESPGAAPPAMDTPVAAAIPVAPREWAVERDPASRGSVTASAGSLLWEYGLGEGVPAGQYVALATSAGGDAALDRIEFTAASAAPMRLSVQIRLPGGPDGRRWRRSVYLDQQPRRVSLSVAELEPVEGATSLRPIRARVQAVLLVVDTLNAKPGTAGTITLTDVTLVAAPSGGGRQNPGSGPDSGSN